MTAVTTSISADRIRWPHWRRAARHAAVLQSAVALTLCLGASPAAATPELDEPRRAAPEPVAAEPEPEAPSNVVREIPSPDPGSGAAAGEVVAQPGSELGDGPVSARRREESAQDTPVSVRAFDANDLEANDIRRADDVAPFTPNLKFQAALGTASAAGIQIRGVGGSEVLPTRDPAVGMYLDGVYLARPEGQLLGLGDVERVEVLRGPQGALFGRNAMGGAIQVITRKPSDQFEADTSLRIGNFDLFESRGSLNLPLLPERAAARFSFQTVSRDGFTDNQLRGQQTDNRRLLGGRLALVLNPSEDVEWLLSAEQQRTHSAGRGGQCRYTGSAQPSPLLDGMNGAFDFRGACLQSAAGDGLEFRSPVRSRDNVDVWGLSSTLTWDFRSVTFKSITAWRRNETDRVQDLSLAEVNAARLVDRGEQQDQVSQELSWSGSTLDGRLAWTGGLSGFYEKGTPGRSEQFLAMDLCELVPSAQICGASSVQRAGMRTHAYAAFGQFTYDLTQSLHFSAGLRRSTERKAYRQSQQAFAGPERLGAVFQTSQSARFRNWSPLLNLSYDVSDRALVYATFSRGFRSGGFNARPSAADSSTLEPFGQETLQSFEVGLKSSWLDRRLLANISLFRGNYDDLQQTLLSRTPGSGFGERVANAAQARVQGAEIELRALPMAGLDLSVGLGFTDAEYRKFVDRSGPLAIDRSHDDFPGTPDFTALISAAYTLNDVLDVGDVTARLNWIHSEAVNYGPSSRFDALRQGRYGLMSGQLSLALADRKTEIALFGANLLNRRYIDGGLPLEERFGMSLAYFGTPRTYGLEVRRHF